MYRHHANALSRCEQFALRGCKVYATSRNVKTMEGFSDPTIEKLALDVTSDDDVQRVVAHVLEVEGKIDVVVNNAGILAIGKQTMTDQPLRDIDVVLQGPSLTFRPSKYRGRLKQTRSHSCASPGLSSHPWQNASMA